MITIVDYGMGNLGSIQNMFKRLGVKSLIASDREAISGATKIVLPGVGAFDAAIDRITNAGLLDVLHRKALVEQVPVLGICLGMQLMTRGSEEGKRPGFGWIPASTKRFASSGDLKVPHMGWNRVRPLRSHPLLTGTSDDTRFYFVHSYYVHVDDEADSLLRTTHGVEFDAAIGRGNIFGAQFHPEKSHRFGQRLLGNFSSI